MNRLMAWDDLRVVLAVAEVGSLSGAGRTLGASHATVHRRLADIEQRLGVTLFTRARRGYTPTVAGTEIAEAARRVAHEVLDVERRVVGRDLAPSGTLRVTTTDSLLAGLLTPILKDFRAEHPNIALEAVVSDQVHSLSRREADVAVRPSNTPPETLVGRRLGRIAQAVYAPRAMMAEAGMVPEPEPEPEPEPDGTPAPALTRFPWIGPDESMGYAALTRWMTRHGLGEACGYRVGSVFGIFSAVRAGAGLAVLPCYLGEGEARLVRVSAPLPDLATDLWWLTHPDLRATARIRLFSDFVAAAVGRRVLDPWHDETTSPDGPGRKTRRRT
jgi:DNA-binding transcriptional LysR family regulator